MDELLRVDVARRLEDEQQGVAVDLELGPLMGVDGVLDRGGCSSRSWPRSSRTAAAGLCSPIHTKPSRHAAARAIAVSRSTVPPCRSPWSYSAQSTAAGRTSRLGTWVSLASAPGRSVRRRAGGGRSWLTGAD